MRHLASFLVLGLVCATPALAEFTPPWSRSDPLAAYHHYTYSAAPSPTTDGAPGGVYYPEELSNPFGGLPSSWDTMYADYAPGGQGTWYPTFEGRTGVASPSALSAEGYWVWLPSSVASQQQLYVQMVWSTFGNTSRPRFDVRSWDGLMTKLTGGVEEEVPLEGSWCYTRWHFDLVKSPGFEALFISPGCGHLYLDDLAVDLRTPEPRSLLLLAGSALLRRRHL